MSKNTLRITIRNTLQRNSPTLKKYKHKLNIQKKECFYEEHEITVLKCIKCSHIIPDKAYWPKKEDLEKIANNKRKKTCIK